MNILNEIIGLVVSQTGTYKSKLNRSTKIEKDLGVTGDDALELMEAFIERFSVKHDGFELNKYFDEEGFDLLGLSYLIRRIKGEKRIVKSNHELTIGDLEDWVKRGFWKAP